MAESLIDIKRRIVSTKKTGQITSAMQMVSGAKLMKLEARARSYQVYASRIRDIVTHLAAAKMFQNLEHPEESLGQSEVGKKTDRFKDLTLNSFLAERPVKRTGYLVLTSDRGLVGGYNSNVLRTMMDLLGDYQSSDDYVILSVGNMGTQFFKSRKIPLGYEYTGVSDVPSFEEARKIVTTAVEMYAQGLFDQLYVCYNHHVNSLTSAFRAERMLPITDLETDKVDVESQSEYLAVPSVGEALDAILPQYIESLIYGAIVDAKTAEHASSMTAMRSATDNADDLIKRLSLQMNRARQAQITTEITEIVGGAAALE